MNEETIRFDLISNEFYSFRFSICKCIDLFVFGCCLLLLFLFGITNEKCLSKFEKKKNSPLDVSNTCLQKKNTLKNQIPKMSKIPQHLLSADRMSRSNILIRYMRCSLFPGIETKSHPFVVIFMAAIKAVNPQ